MIISLLYLHAQSVFRCTKKIVDFTTIMFCSTALFFNAFVYFLIYEDDRNLCPNEF